MLSNGMLREKMRLLSLVVKPLYLPNRLGDPDRLGLGHNPYKKTVVSSVSPRIGIQF